MNNRVTEYCSYYVVYTGTSFYVCASLRLQTILKTQTQISHFTLSTLQQLNL
jgi:hypothetical protein